MELTAEAGEAYSQMDASLDHSYSFWSALIRAYVKFPIATDREYFSCGMHLLGQPDLIVPIELLESVFDAPVPACLDLFYVFAMYLLAECPAGAFAPGNTFRLDADSPRFTLNWEPCTRHEEDDYFFNPFGIWRFGMD